MVNLEQHSPTLAEIHEQFARVQQQKLKIEAIENPVERTYHEEELGEHEDWLLEQIATLSPSQN